MNLVPHFGSSYYLHNKDNTFWTQNLVQILALKSVPRLGALATYFLVPPTNEFYGCGDALAARPWYNYYESSAPLKECALQFNPDEIAVYKCRKSTAPYELPLREAVAARVTPAAAGRTRSVNCGTLRGRRQRLKTAPQNLLNLAPANTCPENRNPYLSLPVLLTRVVVPIGSC